MPFLIAGLALFLGVHLLTTRRAARAALIERLGPLPYKGAYSLLALLGLVLIAHGFGVYRREGPIEIWSPPLWTRHLALLLVWASFICLPAAYLPGHVRRVLKHPMLVAVKLWATAHLLANGDLGSILLFGGFLAWAVIARISLKRRAETAEATAAPASTRADAIALVLGTLAWYVFARWLHPLLIGVPVWPGT